MDGTTRFRKQRRNTMYNGEIRKLSIISVLLYGTRTAAPVS